jgi:sulfite reductase (NADPH) flavoprotein alpha-component
MGTTTADHGSTASVSAPQYSRQRPFWAEITSQTRLSRDGSSKDTRHIVVNLEGSGLSYVPGDSLGVFGSNAPDVVQQLIQVLGFDPETPMNDGAGGITVLRELLSRDYIINRANRKILGALAEIIPQGEQRNRLMEIVDNDGLLCEIIETRDFVDVLRDFSEARFQQAEAFVAHLTPVTPRLYSIASSPLAHPGEAHLCVAVIRYGTHGRKKKGLASGFLADHADVLLKSVPVYVQPARTFRLPEDGSRDIIMIGPGTGIAPFRAFLEHRAAKENRGKNWLFFGEQRRATDFLYEQEWQEHIAAGRLHRFDVAFSRDQAEKDYVQHRMREHAKDIWDWIQRGAFIYVCGDARRMAKDVHQTLIDLAAEQGGMSAEKASEYVNVTLMKTEKRYLRDIY